MFGRLIVNILVEHRDKSAASDGVYHTLNQNSWKFGHNNFWVLTLHDGIDRD